MNKLARFISVCAVAAMPLTTFAETKVAVLSLQKAVERTTFAQKSLEKMKQTPDVAANMKEGQRLKSKLEKLMTDAKKNEAILSDAEKKDILRKQESLQADLKNVARKLQESQAQLMEQLSAKFGPQMKPIIDKIIKDERIDLLLDLDRAPIMHISPKIDLTAKVTAKLNEIK